ncbi:hypothetical protein Q7C36_009523 [Tachysurus vachellii]|uniref:Uncharacterized protein n=1 Tax=Tachysurus vachellii TaxID=175792 RepID=A0AA88N1E2_TACVA|nr:hypothetical protein Q7C36_009523 [Tachysurus vachellii]
MSLLKLLKKVNQEQESEDSRHLSLRSNQSKMFHFCTSIGNASARAVIEDNVSSPAIRISQTPTLSSVCRGSPAACGSATDQRSVSPRDTSTRA